MVDFDELVVMREGFLKKLNIAIDQVIDEKKELDIDYDLLEKALEKMLKNVGNIQTSPIDAVTPIKKEEMLKIALDFFESIDPEFHKKAIEVILQQNESIKMNIYNRHKIKDFKKRDERGLLEYTPGGSVHTRKGLATVHIPTRNDVYSKEEKILNKDECTLQDLYIIVHEIAHLFDMDLQDDRPTIAEFLGEDDEKSMITRALLCETTSISFESMLSEYLLENKLYSKKAIQEISKNNIQYYLHRAKSVYAKLVLAREKSENGDIDLKFIEKMMRDNGLSIQDTRRMAHDIIHDSGNLLYDNRYALGGLIAPTIIKRYKEDGAGTLKKYLEEVKKENFEGAMDVLGIELNGEGINELVVNMKELTSRINEKER